MRRGTVPSGAFGRPVPSSTASRGRQEWGNPHAKLGYGLVQYYQKGVVTSRDAFRRSLLVHASLIVDARYLALGVMSEYRYTGETARSYRDARDLLQAIYGSGRLELPFEGVLLFGY